jgi:hypothetical protein
MIQRRKDEGKKRKKEREREREKGGEEEREYALFHKIKSDADCSSGKKHE